MTHHIRLLDAHSTDGKALQLSTRQQRDVTIVDMFQL